MQGIDKADSVLAIIKDFRLATDTTNTILTRVSAVWDSFADKTAIFPRLQDLYTRRQVAENFWLGVWDRVNFDQDGVKEDASDYAEHWKELHDYYQAEIVRLETRPNMSRAPVVGCMTRTAPRMTRHYPNPNNPAYGGDPQLRSGDGRPF